MLPVMLVRRARLIFVSVALSLSALFPVVTSAIVKGGAPSGSEDLALHATKSPPGNISAGLDAGSWNTSRTMNDASQAGDQSPSWSGGIISTRNNNNRDTRKSSADNNSDDDSNDKRRPAFWSEDIQVGCRELRAQRYITDGFCTSEKPIREVVCAGNCLPIMELPWYAEFVKTIGKDKLRDYECVEDLVRKKRVKLLCQDATYRRYKIKVVKSCKCKKITKKHNRTSYKKKRRRRRKRRKNKKNKTSGGS